MEGPSERGKEHFGGWKKQKTIEYHELYKLRAEDEYDTAFII